MSLIERMLPVAYRRDYSFFDHLFSGMAHDMAEMEADMDRVRARMFQLVPWDDRDVTHMQMDVERPIIEDEKGQAKLHLKFNVSDFKPEEVKVKMVGGNQLQVNAEHHEKGDGHEVHKVFCRQYSLPQGVSPETITAEVTKDGVLTVEGPAPPLDPSEKLIPITYKK